MAGKLTAKEVEAAAHPKTHARPVRIHDGDGLYLQIAPAGTKSWLFRFTLAGRAREMGLGAFAKPARCGEPQVGVPLADARDKAAAARAVLQKGIDPIEHRAAQLRRQTADRQRAETATFKALAEEMVASREVEWKNAKHVQQWKNTLASYAYPIIGALPVAEIATDDVLRVLKPIWATKPETASRLRGRIERVLAYAKARGFRSGDNPAAWRDHLAESLPSPRRIQGKLPGHHAALPWQQVGDFMVALRRAPSASTHALAFLILTASRTMETLGARWREFDLADRAWTVPAERMKAKKEHRVPLSEGALAELRAMMPLADGPNSFVFPGRSAGTGLSQMALMMLLRRMNAAAQWLDGRTGEPITAHGFRSTFRDWCGEASGHPTDLAEAALAHTIRDKTVAAYARGDLFERRRALMEDWAEFCSKPSVARTAKPIVRGRAA